VTMSRRRRRTWR